MNEPPRSESPDARAWWTLAVVVAVVLIAYLGLSAGQMSSHDEARPANSASPSTGASETERSETENQNESDDDSTSEPTSTATSKSTSSSTSTSRSMPDVENPKATGPAPSATPVDAQSLREFGELGVLPGLLDDFSSVPDCDFDDALSTCQ